MWLVFAVAAAKLAVHLYAAPRYGFFGDELYYLACGEHLNWGYVDQPPLIAIIARLVRHVLGESLFAVRFLPAVAGAALVLLSGMITREIGGQRFAMGLAALSVASIGLLFTMHYLFTMNAFEPLFWLGCAYLVIRIIHTGNQKLWVWFGLLAGVGLENKYSMAVFSSGILVGLLLTPERKAFAHKWIWLGGGLAALIFLPNVVWNIRHDWPFFELMRNIRRSERDISLGPIEYLMRQIVLIGPLNFPIWLAGIWYLLGSSRAKAYRPLGWAFVTTLAFFIVTKGKDYYAAPAFPVALVGGAVWLEGLTERAGLRWLRATLVSLLLVTTLASLPFALPVLPVESYVRYQAKLPFVMPASERSHLQATLPHHYAWQFGWEEMTAAVARTYHSLPPQERAKTAIFGNNFAEAGAIDLLGSKYGLPKAIGNHQSYSLWGPRSYTGEVMIVLGDTPESLQRWCTSVEVAAQLNHPYARPVENRPVLICRGLKGNLQELWPRLKNWD